MPKSDYPLYCKKIERFFEAFDSLPLSPRFDLDGSQDMDSYDTVVVGSDEVWNLFHPWYGKHPLFYGEGLKAQHLISYPASFGNYPASTGLNEEWSEKLRSFDAISVRDENSRLLVSNACNFCDDVVAETSDISFGDAWVEPYSSDGRGTNVVVVRSPEVVSILQEAIKEGRLQLQGVDSRFVEQTQAAGFRQHREGLAYRLTWTPRGVQPRKRVAPDVEAPTPARKMIYRIRYYLSAGSHTFFRLARLLHLPQLYIRWARLAAAVYHGLAYHRGRLGHFVKRLGLNQ